MRGTLLRLPKIKVADFGHSNSIAEQVISGVVEGCREAGCALVGGETAEMRGLFPDDGGIYDINGTASGAIAKGKQLLPRKAAMKSGDVLLGLASSGCHSNGFSLIRKIVQERAGLNYNDPSPWSKGETIGDSLLVPTRIYVRSVLAATEKDLVKGMAHITGGGLTENVPRMLPSHLSAVLDATTWKVPEVLKWLKKTGNMTEVRFFILRLLFLFYPRTTFLEETFIQKSFFEFDTYQARYVLTLNYINRPNLLRHSTRVLVW